jgi:hypothetical protein
MAPPRLDPPGASLAHGFPTFSERRRHLVFVTQRAEYHVRDGICVAVRRRGEEAFTRGHLCENRPLQAGSVPRLGEPLSFDGPLALATPIVVEVRRAARADVDRYAISA